MHNNYFSVQASILKEGGVVSLIPLPQKLVILAGNTLIVLFNLIVLCHTPNAKKN